MTPAGAERFRELEAVADATDAEIRALLPAGDAAGLHDLLAQLHGAMLATPLEGEHRAS